MHNLFLEYASFIYYSIFSSCYWSAVIIKLKAKQSKSPKLIDGPPSEIHTHRYVLETQEFENGSIETFLPSIQTIPPFDEYEGYDGYYKIEKPDARISCIKPDDQIPPNPSDLYVSYKPMDLYESDDLIFFVPLGALVAFIIFCFLITTIFIKHTPKSEVHDTTKYTSTHGDDLADNFKPELDKMIKSVEVLDDSFTSENFQNMDENEGSRFTDDEKGESKYCKYKNNTLMTYNKGDMQLYLFNSKNIEIFHSSTPKSFITEENLFPISVDFIEEEKSPLILVPLSDDIMTTIDTVFEIQEENNYTDLEISLNLELEEKNSLSFQDGQSSSSTTAVALTFKHQANSNSQDFEIEELVKDPINMQINEKSGFLNIENDPSNDSKATADFKDLSNELYTLSENKENKNFYEKPQVSKNNTSISPFHNKKPKKTVRIVEPNDNKQSIDDSKRSTFSDHDITQPGTPDLMRNASILQELNSENPNHSPSKIPILSPSRPLNRPISICQQPIKISEEVLDIFFRSSISSNEKAGDLFLDKVFGPDPEVKIFNDLLIDLTMEDIDKITSIYRGRETSGNWKDRYDNFDVLIAHLRLRLPEKLHSYFMDRIYENIEDILEMTNTMRSKLLLKTIVFLRDIVYYGKGEVLLDEVYVTLVHILIPLTKSSQTLEMVHKLASKSLCLMIRSIDINSFLQNFDKTFLSILMNKKLKREKSTALLMVKFYILSNRNKFNENGVPYVEMIIEKLMPRISSLACDACQKTRTETVEIYLILHKILPSSELLARYYHCFSSFTKSRIPKPVAALSTTGVTL
ncbi:hypothetical protein WICMUC_005468 [Wickerhamomyces mucosus]|uniref:Protein STU1 n=1 Tax=Wickerhamomyces mucosus TaxID=1378264 RepID=A0A9P8P8L4_9ASCO|nr:hypothetical protein WICMUC_005468 [Wickerhamomyces mucosus]